MFLLAKYGTQMTLSFPMVKRGVVDLAVSADWTPATGDTKVSKDQGAIANTTNNPSIISGSVIWTLVLTATEMQAAVIDIQIVDSATKAVEDQFIKIYTYGHASARFQPDLSDIVRMGLTSLPNANAEAAGGLYTRGTGAGQVNQNANGQLDTRWVAGNVTVGSITASAIQSIWDALTSALTTASSIGKLLVDNVNATIGSRATQTSVDIIDDFLDTEIAAIKDKTDNLPTDPADASDIASSFTAVNTKLDTIDDFLDTEIAAIKAKTDNLPIDPADASDVSDAISAVNSTVGAVVALIDETVVPNLAAVKAKTDLLPEGIKKNQSFSNFMFMMLDSTTGAAKTGLTDGSFTKKVSIDGGTPATLSGTISEIDATNMPGWYKISSLSSGELNGNNIALRFAASGCKDTELSFKTSP